MQKRSFLRCIWAATVPLFVTFFVLTSWIEVTVGSSVASSTTETTSIPNTTVNLTDFGAVGDGVADDGPAIQAALDSIAEAGGGTLLVPAGRYAIVTPVAKDFSGLAQSVTIQGVESSTQVPPPTAGGSVLTRGLNLTSEFYPRTGSQQIALKIKGLQSFLIKDIAFVGTPNVNNDAWVTLAIEYVEGATVKHCEFYGLSTLTEGGAIVMAMWSGLTIEQSVILGCTASSGVYSSIIQNLYWKGITVTDSVFADYGQRPELFGKMGLAAPFSWISIENAVAADHNSPRREVVISRVFLDEGALQGVASRPNGYLRPSAPIDLLYVSDIFVNVSNLHTSGHYLEDLSAALIEKSHYGWSQHADSAINLVGVSNAILNRIECIDHANQLHADATTGRLTVINSIYDELLSQAVVTSVIDDPAIDPIESVREKFTQLLGRAPEPAALYYWSDKLLRCGNNSQCESETRAALTSYLNNAPATRFAAAGRIVDELGAGVAGALVRLSGSQTVMTESDVNGYFHFSNLPTSGVYSVSAAKPHYTFTPSSFSLTNPAGDQSINLNARVNRHSITGKVAEASGNAVSGVAISLSGSAQAGAVTDANGNYAFLNLAAGGDYTVSAAKADYTITPPSLSFANLGANQTANFSARSERHKIRGRVTNANNAGVGGVTVHLSGSDADTTTTDAQGDFEFTNLREGGNYIVSPILLLFDPPSQSFSDLNSDQYSHFILTGAASSTVEFASSSLTATEDAGVFQVRVTRSGNTSSEASVLYCAPSGTAQQGHDVNSVIGQLNFAAGETSKTITVFITDDAFIEEDEHLTLILCNAENAALGVRTSVMLTIIDDDTLETDVNPIDDARTFVRQQYRDFLNRDPDAAGLDFWAGQIEACGNDSACVASVRQHVSAAFFLSIEFQETGYLVYRLYKSAYTRVPQRVQEFLCDTGLIRDGVIVGSLGWEQKLELNKTSYLTRFVDRPEFIQRYPLSLTPAQFVSALNANTGSSLSQAEVAVAIAEFAGAATSSDRAARRRALRKVVENATFIQRETTNAFVQMQYFGYLQRHSDDPPDLNLDGFHFWLNKLIQFGGNYAEAEMVRAFIESTEYRTRFGR